MTRPPLLILLSILAACDREPPTSPTQEAILRSFLRSASVGLVAYVANQGSNTVSVIETASNTVTATVSVGSRPRGVAITPKGDFAYVANIGSNDVSVIETASNTVTATVSVGFTPVGVASTGDFAYVTNSGSGTVSVIETASNTVTATVSVGSAPEGVAVTPKGDLAYVVNVISNTVSVIETASNTVIATVSVGFGPFGVAITPKGDFAYVANIGSNDVSVIETASNTVTATVSVGSNPLGVAITPKGDFAYVANLSSNTVSVIETASNTVTATISVGSGPEGVVITPKGDFAYVTNTRANTVSVIETASNTVTATVSVGSEPVGVAITPKKQKKMQGAVVRPPTITSEPQSVTVRPGKAATFVVAASGSSPLSYQWKKNAVLIIGANLPTYTTPPTSLADSGTTSSYTVTVSNSGGSVTSAPASLTVIGQPVYGLSGFRPLFTSGPNDLTGAHYRFVVTQNQGLQFHIIFAVNRLYSPGSPLSYLIESNVYSGTQYYLDGGCTTWPLLGTYREGTASLRTAIPDYNFAAGLQPGITTGMLTGDATNWPVQTYLIDNIPNLHKSDAISQFGLNGLETELTIHRADTTSNVSAYSRCNRPLVAGLYRRWLMTLGVQGRPPVIHEFVVPESSGRYLTVNEVMNFASEFLHTASLMAVQLWDFQITRESDPLWRPVGTFISSPVYDGDGTDYGIHLVNVSGQSRVEFSNQPGIQYISANTIFSY